MRQIPLPCQQARNRNILVKRVPVHPPPAEFIALTLGFGGVEQAWKPCERNTEGAAIIKLNPHAIIVKAQGFRRNSHSKLLQADRDVLPQAAAHG